MNPDEIWGYCNCGQPIYERATYCPDCQRLSDGGKIKELLRRHKAHTTVLTGEIYKQGLENCLT